MASHEPGGGRESLGIRKKLDASLACFLAEEGKGGTSLLFAGWLRAGQSKSTPT